MKISVINNVVTIERHCSLNVLNISCLRVVFSAAADGKITEIFCIADDFCKVLKPKWKNTPRLALVRLVCTHVDSKFITGEADLFVELLARNP